MQYQRIDKHLLSSSLAGETIMLNSNNGDYLSLNRVSTKIWELLENPIDLDEIVNQLLQEFEVSKATCELEVQNFLNQLIAANILKAI